MSIPKGTHIRLTKAQRATFEGLELIHLLQSITEDGKFTPSEIIELTKWLRRNKESEIPAIKHLLVTVEAVIADGRVTQKEQETLYCAIERVLPKELEALAADHREEIRERYEEQHKAERAAERAVTKAAEKTQALHACEEAKAEQFRNRVVSSFNFMVAGIRHEGREGRINSHAKVGQEIVVVREPRNTHSRNACRLFMVPGMIEIGYVPEVNNFGEPSAVSLSRELDQGYKYVAYIYKLLGPSWAQIPVVVVETFDRTATQATVSRILRADLVDSASPGIEFRVTSAIASTHSFPLRSVQADWESKSAPKHRTGKKFIWGSVLLAILVVAVILLKLQH